MFTKSESFLYFILGCIPVRLLLVFLTWNIAKNHSNYMKLLGLLLLLPSLGFLYLYFTNGRQRAFEAGGKTWWANLRLIHGLLYLSASIYALKGDNKVWVPLLLDVVLGFLAFMCHNC
jgi:isoprenylcysteine carboxyl methyltransferase (ICMT) family protein YpbQ